MAVIVSTSASCDDDLYFTPDILRRLDMSIQQAKEGQKIKLTPELCRELFS